MPTRDEKANEILSHMGDIITHSSQCQIIIENTKNDNRKSEHSYFILLTEQLDVGNARNPIQGRESLQALAGLMETAKDNGDFNVGAHHLAAFRITPSLDDIAVVLLVLVYKKAGTPSGEVETEHKVAEIAEERREDVVRVVQRIIRHKVEEDGQILFLVHWEDYVAADSTWETVATLRTNAIFQSYIDSKGLQDAISISSSRRLASSTTTTTTASTTTTTTTTSASTSTTTTTTVAASTPARQQPARVRSTPPSAITPPASTASIAASDREQLNLFLRNFYCDSKLNTGEVCCICQRGRADGLTKSDFYLCVNGHFLCTVGEECKQHWRDQLRHTDCPICRQNSNY